jgi:uncharacterized protein
MKRLNQPIFLLMYAVACFSNPAHAQYKNDTLWIDKFDQVKLKTLTNANWYTYSDKATDGGSSITLDYSMDTELKSQVLTCSYKLNKKNWKYDPYATMACHLKGKEIYYGIQAIAYEFKGSAHTLMFRTKNIKDYAFYRKTINKSETWTTVTIPIAELKQPKYWGSPKRLILSELEGLAWQADGASGDSGYIAIDNVRLIYNQDNENNPDHIISAGNIKTLYSNVLKEDRDIWIALPDPLAVMKASKKKYAVVYVLDGDYNLKALAGVMHQLSMVEMIPPMIVVGIPNTNRWRDLTPSHVKKTPFLENQDSLSLSYTGGGANFMKFIESELIPYIDAKYPTMPHRTLIGHSLGGLTVVNTLIHYPQVFDNYLAIDPSLWWDDHKLTDEAKEVLENKKFDDKKLFIATANTMYDGLDTATVRKDTSNLAYHMRCIFEFEDELKKNPGNSLNYVYKYYPDDNHSSVPVIAEYDALRYFFKYYKANYWPNPQAKELPTEASVVLHYTTVSKNLKSEVLPPENVINHLGYEYMKKKDYKTAYAFFSRNIQNYPQSNNVFDSMGDYYKEVGEKKKAIDMYKKALALEELVHTRNKLKKL